MRTSNAILLAGSAVMAATVLGGRFGPGPRRPATQRWYADLDKPGWTPSGATIGGVWTVVNAFLIWSGTRMLKAPPSPARTRALALWGFNVASIAAWQAIFFGARRLGASVAYDAAMVGCGLAYVATARQVDAKAAAAGLPYPTWVSIAGVLAAQLWRRNAAPAAAKTPAAPADELPRVVRRKLERAA